MLNSKPTQGDSFWFVHDRFGMFIHWGLYALPARHEWVKSREEISDEDYQPYFDHFNPTLYDPKQWAHTAREAGMKYVVITTKHHEGFCLWDTQYTDYKVTNTPYGKDLIAPFVDAFRAEGLRIGFYYSLIDWHHPDFTIDVHHPLRNLENTIDEFWLKQLPIFTKHHQILLFIVFTDEWKIPNKWQSDTLKNWQNQILNDIPVVRIQF